MAPWTPITNFPGGVDEFTGTYDGGGKAISGLQMSGALGSYAGLFRATDGATIKYVTLTDVSIASDNDAVGSLAAVVNNSTISNVHATGSVSGSGSIGGLFASVGTTTVSGSSFSGTVRGGTNVGGLSGWTGEGAVIEDSTSAGQVLVNGGLNDDNGGGLVGYALGTRIVRSTSTTSVTGKSMVGGLVGATEGIDITESGASGDVRGEYYVGGAIGRVYEGRVGPSSISRIWAKGDVTGVGGSSQANDLGGLIGAIETSSYDVTLTQSYATGNLILDGQGVAGGLIGDTEITDPAYSIRITDVYSRGSISGANTGYLGGLLAFMFDTPQSQLTHGYTTSSVPAGPNSGGFVGQVMAQNVSGFWNATSASPITVSAAGTQVTQAEMKSLKTYADAGWKIRQGWVAANPDPAADATVWGICDTVNDGYPFLLWQFSSDPCPSPKPDPTPTPTPAQPQSITPAPVFPKTLHHPGRTVVFSTWLVTNAGQRVHASARFSTLKGLRPSGDVRLGTYRVTKSGKFIVRVLTKKPVRVPITLHAKATSGYLALNQTKVYRLK